MRRRVRIGGNGVAVGRMIVAYSRGDGAATNYEIAWVTVALQHLRVGDDPWTRIDPVHCSRRRLGALSLRSRWRFRYGRASAGRLARKA